MSARSIRGVCRCFKKSLIGVLVWALMILVAAVSLSTSAQDSYEIQVYGSETVPGGRTMVELHSNFTIDGQRETVNDVYPSHHAIHETLEITHGFTPWFETGFYVFT